MFFASVMFAPTDSRLLHDGAHLRLLATTAGPRAAAPFHPIAQDARHLGRGPGETQVHQVQRW